MGVRGGLGVGGVGRLRSSLKAPHVVFVPSSGSGGLRGALDWPAAKIALCRLVAWVASWRLFRLLAASLIPGCPLLSNSVRVGGAPLRRPPFPRARVPAGPRAPSAPRPRLPSCAPRPAWLGPAARRRPCGLSCRRCSVQPQQQCGTITAPLNLAAPWDRLRKNDINRGGGDSGVRYARARL